MDYIRNIYVYVYVYVYVYIYMHILWKMIFYLLQDDCGPRPLDYGIYLKQDKGSLCDLRHLP